MKNSAVNAIYYLDADSLEELIFNDEFDKTMLLDINEPTFKCAFRIQYITKCWDYILKPELFKEKHRDTIEKLREKNERIKVLFKECLAVEMNDVDVPFWQYIDAMAFSGALDCPIEELTDETLEEHIAHGERDIDVVLYQECGRVNDKACLELLNKGADPSALIKIGNNYDTPLGVITNVLYYILDEFLCYNDFYKLADEEGYDFSEMEISSDHLSAFITWAGYEKIYMLFRKYDKREYEYRLSLP